MKLVHNPQLIIAALLLMTAATVKAGAGPFYHTPPPAPRASAPPPAPVFLLVDGIKGIGKFKFGAHLTDFANDSLQIVDPRAKGVLLRVCPYGDNYLVTDLTGLSWENIPLAGLILTFHEGILIDLQLALKARKIDLYQADRAFKDTYGPNRIRTLPVQAWPGDRIQVTLIFVGMNIADAKSLDGFAQGKVDLFDQARWDTFEAARKAKLDEVPEKQHQDAGKKVKANL